MDTAPVLNRGHYYELDSLRGLAALTVMIHHILLVLPVFALPYLAPMPFIVRLIRFSPLGVIMAGREAVIFFFVLSGFVLALPFLKQDKVLPYRPYIIKRICRIYPPYLIAVAFAILMNTFCYRGTTAGLSEWFTTFWQPRIDWQAAFEHLPLINSFASTKFDPVIWSLIVEMRLSLLFPLIIYFVLKFGWRANLLGGILCSFIGWGFYFLKHRNVIHFEHNYFDTFSCILMFVVGALLAQNRDWLKEKFLRLKKTGKYTACCLTLLAYTNGCWLEHLFPSPLLQKFLSSQLPQDFMVTAAVAAFIIMALASGKISRVLLLKPLHYLGKISYSFYLFHMICLLALVHLFYGVLPFPLIILLVILASFGTAALSYHWIEVPCIRLGRRLTQGP